MNAFMDYQSVSVPLECYLPSRASEVLVAPPRIIAPPFSRSGSPHPPAVLGNSNSAGSKARSPLWQSHKDLERDDHLPTGAGTPSHTTNEIIGSHAALSGAEFDGAMLC
jgi:hypothetical protein